MTPRCLTMKVLRVAFAALSVIGCCAGILALQQTADFGFSNDDSPPKVKAEFYWSRLAYTSNMNSAGSFGRRGWFNSWSRDYPKADRQFLIAMHRLTRIDGRQTERGVTLARDDLSNYPGFDCVEVQ